VSEEPSPSSADAPTAVRTRTPRASDGSDWTHLRRRRATDQRRLGAKATLQPWGRRGPSHRLGAGAARGGRCRATSSTWRASSQVAATPTASSRRWLSRLTRDSRRDCSPGPSPASTASRTKSSPPSVSVIPVVMQAAIRSGARRDNPGRGHHVPVRRRRIRQGDVLTMTGVHAPIDRVRDPHKPAVWLLVLTEMRPAEPRGLRVRSIDFVRNLVSIRETLLPSRRRQITAWNSSPGLRRQRQATERSRFPVGSAIRWPASSPSAPRRGALRSSPRNCCS
jgi:hypothetical protein